MMKRMTATLIALGFLCGILSATKYKAEKKEEIRKTLKFPDPTGRKELTVDNIYGSIQLEGYDGNEVQLLANKTIKARSKDRIERAEEEVELEINQDGNSLELYVDGPFRCNNQGKRWRDPGYTVTYDFKIKVPRNSDIYLKTVNGGDVTAANIDGDFEVRNVNGAITIEGISGAGNAHTVNGKVKVVFSRNPQEDCSFKTINGDVDIYFRDKLACAFLLKTFNGDMLSDFPVTYKPIDSAKSSRKSGKFVFKSGRFVGVQTGKGGPEIKMDTLNGDILINKR
jgi:hypothetical protein